MAQWELQIAFDRLPVWLNKLHGGDESAGGGESQTRTITFAEAVASGVIPPSGEPMSGLGS